ncbi:MAG: molybdopterin-guanine dinucleotide biosynthesis protein B [Gemmatimonadales bacterium]
MAAARILSIIGRKDTGKTTLLVALAQEFKRRGKRVMTIKHASHTARLDEPGTDSWRHYHEGGASRVLLAAPEMRAIIDRTPDEDDPITLAREHLDGADLILVEGFKRAPLPKIEVFRREVADQPLYDESAPNADEWVALLTDDPHYRAACHVLRFQDTIWPQTLASIAWDRSKVLP